MIRRTSSILVLSSAMLALMARGAIADVTERISLGRKGAEANGDSYSPAVSGNGRFIAYLSEASNLVRGDRNDLLDVFVYDRITKKTRRASVSSKGKEANNADDLGIPRISKNGRFICFASTASNLVAKDTNNVTDIFVHDLETRQTRRVSVASDGTQANNFSWYPDISANGRYVSFTSPASNLVPNDRNDGGDVFVHDLKTGETTLVSLATDGSQADLSGAGQYQSSISADGRFVAFEHYANNLVPGNTNQATDIFVRDRQQGTTTLVTRGSGGAPADLDSSGPKISGDGKRVAFNSDASNLVQGDSNGYADVFVRDLKAGTTTIATVAPDGTPANEASGLAAISGDGKLVGFYSGASNLVAGDTNDAFDQFIRILSEKKTQLLAININGEPAGNGSVGLPSFSTDGSVVAFNSRASDLVPGDLNGQGDIFIRLRDAD